jgi:hypothetical protein
MTESEIKIAFSKIFKGGVVTKESLEKAELLLRNLRNENPLRIRLNKEVVEIRKKYKIFS